MSQMQLRAEVLLARRVAVVDVVELLGSARSGRRCRRRCCRRRSGRRPRSTRRRAASRSRARARATRTACSARRRARRPRRGRRRGTRGRCGAWRSFSVGAVDVRLGAARGTGRPPLARGSPKSRRNASGNSRRQNHSACVPSARMARVDLHADAEAGRGERVDHPALVARRTPRGVSPSCAPVTK